MYFLLIYISISIIRNLEALQEVIRDLWITPSSKNSTTLQRRQGNESSKKYILPS